MKNREALLNAGFEKSYDKPDCVTKVVDETRIYVNYKNLDIALHKINDTAGTFPESYCEVRALNLESVKNLLGCFGFDLDFTAKPKYDWETVCETLDQEQQHTAMHYINSVVSLADMEIIDKAEMSAMIAKLKLNIIIQQIDKDYPLINSEQEWAAMINLTKYTDSPSELDAQNTPCRDGGLITTASIEGAKILLDQNPQLLQNLFKIETDATGED